MATKGSGLLAPSVHAVGHQSAIEHIIQTMVNLPTAQFMALGKGGSRVLEKLVRSYHYWAEEYAPSGICPYDHPRLGFFRISQAASSESDPRKLVKEHLLPVARLLLELEKAHLRWGPAAGGVVPLPLISGLMDGNEIVILHRSEAPLRPSKDMPAGWVFGAAHDARLPRGTTLTGSRMIGAAGHQVRYSVAASQWPLP